jgi:hypothetical protein
MRRMFTMLALGALFVAGCGDDAAAPDADETPPGATETTADDGVGSVSFAGVQDGDTVTSPVRVDMNAEGIEIEPAGEVRPNAGHFHVMVDTDCVEPGETIPDDAQHLHFGDGSTSAELELEPGQHSLCLQVADGEHTAMDLTDEITVTVEG